MSAYDRTRRELQNERRVWLVTGVAGFIGSNLLESLLKLGQDVVGLDNFETGYRENLDEVRDRVSDEQWRGFRFIEGDVRDMESCRLAVQGVDCVLHQAALGSVPRSLQRPLTTNASNISGFLNMLVAARDAGVQRFVFASSSSVYGDHEELPKLENRIGTPLSPYAVTKRANELYAAAFSHCYGLETIGLRYFNVFGPRQDPDGAYAAVIPRWFGSMLGRAPAVINGDGETSRDFCYVENVVQANLLAATTQNSAASGELYNVACGERTSLKQLFDSIRKLVAERDAGCAEVQPRYSEFRAGDVRHSLADITKAENLLGYVPTHTLEQGLAEAADWYVRKMRVSLH